METMTASFRESFLGDRISRELAIGERLVDPSEILINDPARAEIQVAHLRVPHLSFRQSNIETTGAQFPARIIAIQLVMKRCPREQSRITVFSAFLAAAGIDAPTVANDENDRPRHELSFATLGKTDKWFPGCGLTRPGAGS